MDKMKMLAHIRDTYSRGGNLMDHLKSLSDSGSSCSEDIMISYDFQAGSYVQAFAANEDCFQHWGQAIAGVIDSLDCCDSILEAGVGDGTTLAPVLMAMRRKPQFTFGFDLAWSRVKCAKAFLHSHAGLPAELCMGDLFCTPFADNSIDVVFTSHAIEPNGGRETEALCELYRVARRYLVLVEPSYELAGEEARERIRRLGYITRLYEAAQELGYKIIEHRLLVETDRNPLNPSGLIVIQKQEGTPAPERLCCPITKSLLKRGVDSLYAPEVMLAYPIIQGIACLLPQQAVIATKYEQGFA